MNNMDGQVIADLEETKKENAELRAELVRVRGCLYETEETSANQFELANNAEARAEKAEAVCDKAKQETLEYRQAWVSVVAELDKALAFRQEIQDALMFASLHPTDGQILERVNEGKQALADVGRLAPEAEHGVAWEANKEWSRNYGKLKMERDKALANLANARTILDVLGEERSEIVGSLARGNIAFKGSYAATVNLLVDDYTKLLADYAAMRELAVFAVSCTQSGETIHKDEPMLQRLQTPNPGQKLLDAVAGAKQRYRDLDSRPRKEWSPGDRLIWEAVRALEEK